MTKICLGNLSVANRVFFVAEIGSNHAGSLDIASSLIEEAARRGADAVKFQSFRATTLHRSRRSPQRGMWQVDPTYNVLKKYQLPMSWHARLQKVADDCGVLFLSTAFDLDQAEFLAGLGVPAFKIASGDITFHALLRRVARFGKPILLSTGASYLHEIRTAVRVILDEGNDQIVLLHCVSLYPPRAEDLNLKAVATLARSFNLPVGYSDHSHELANVISAVTLGARVIERHFTFSRSLPGPDNPFATEPEEFEHMVSTVRQLEQALGTGDKVPAAPEIEVRRTGRRGLYARRAIRAGETLSPDMVRAMRPVSGLGAEQISRVLGKIVIQDMEKDEPITEDVFAEDAAAVASRGEQ